LAKKCGLNKIWLSLQRLKPQLHKQSLPTQTGRGI
jgi:hypothetical protein